MFHPVLGWMVGNTENQINFRKYGLVMKFADVAFHIPEKHFVLVNRVICLYIQNSAANKEQNPGFTWDGRRIRRRFVRRYTPERK